tara:strand:+ start:332 stop:535 length:204 start_codon:yes stop_codon:yes gene_type:complete
MREAVALNNHPRVVPAFEQMPRQELQLICGEIYFESRLRLIGRSVLLIFVFAWLSAANRFALLRTML